MQHIIIQVSKDKINRNERISQWDIPEYEIREKFKNIQGMTESDRSAQLEEFLKSKAPYITRDKDLLTIERGIQDAHFAAGYQRFNAELEKLGAVSFDEFAASTTIEDMVADLAIKMDSSDGVYIVDKQVNDGDPVALDHWLRKLNFARNDENPSYKKGLEYYVGSILKYGD